MTQTKSQRLITKVISIIVLISMFGTNIQPTPVIAQENPPATNTDVLESTPTPGGTINPPVSTLPSEVPVSIETPPPPTLTPSILLEPTAEMVKTLDFSAAGEGTYFRVLVSLHQPRDLARLKEWNIKILETFDGYAYVMVDRDQLKKLSYSGFDPSEINSVDYMADMFKALRGSASLSSEALAISSETLMALSGVDTDSDGLTDTEEVWWCTDPNDNNSDSALAPSPSNPSDGAEVRAILSGVTSYGPPFALWPQFTPHNPSGTCPDGDYDSIPDSAEEFVLGTSILRESTDLDKFDDGQEVFGRTFCTGASGPCGYGILPRAEDSAYVSATMPSWVLPPGNSPFVAAFPEPKVEVVPSSIIMTQKTIITNTKGTTTGTEKTYGTASTKGTSSSEANSTTWNEWEETYTTTPLVAQGVTANGPILPGTVDCNNPHPGYAFVCKATVTLINVGYDYCTDNGANLSLEQCKRGANQRIQAVGNAANSAMKYVADKFQYVKQKAVDITNKTKDWIDANVPISSCSVGLPPTISCELLINTRAARNAEQGYVQDQFLGNGSTDRVLDHGGNIYSSDGTSLSDQILSFPMNYPAPQFPTITEGSGREWGGSHTVTHTEYEEQTISESSTNQFSENWSQSIATDPTHAADLRFTYNIVNNGTEYAREITSLIFNVYIGNDVNPAITYCAIGSNPNCEIPSISNFFPGNSSIYTAGSSINTAIRLTDVQMRAIDEGAPVRIVMEDIAFGMDQVFYQDILNGSVLVAMEDGFDDLDETVDSYFIPTLYPTDTLQDVVKRYFPVTEDIDGNLLSVSTPEFTTNPPTFVQHSLTGTSWWNFYLSAGLNYTDAFATTLASANSTVMVRIVSDRDLDGYNDRNEIRLGTNPDDPASHPSPNLLAGYTKSCVGNDCTLRMTFQNLGNYDAYGVEAILYSPDGNVNVTNNTIGGSGRVAAGAKIVVGPSDTFQYTVTGPSPKEVVIVVSYNDPQGNHSFILPASALIADLNNDLTSLNGLMLPDPGVEISSTDATHANFVIFSSHTETITNGKLFVEYIDALGNVAHEDTYTQNFEPGPTVIPVTVDTVTYPPDQYILLAFFTDSQGNIIDSSARPLASFGADPLPEANLTAGDWKVGTRSALVTVPDPWNFGTVQVGTTLYADITLANSGMGNLRYAMTGLGNGLTVTGSASGKLSPSELRSFQIALDTAGLTAGVFNRSLTIRTNDPNHATIAINLTGTIGTPPGTATAYKINDLRPWDQYVYVPGPHNQNDIVTFTHTLTDDPSRMFPLYLYDEAGTTLKGVGEYGVDFSGQTAPFGVFGTGADGDLTVTTGQTIYTDDTRSAVLATANSAQPNIALSSSAGFAAGQEVLIIQIQGTGAGVYEFANIASIGGNTLTLTKNITNTYTAGGNSKAQVIRVMQYHDVTIQSGGTLTSHAWDGNTGGVIAYRATGTVTVNIGGTINGSGRGFRGGVGQSVNLGGQNGESIDGFVGRGGASGGGAGSYGGGSGSGYEVTSPIGSRAGGAGSGGFDRSSEGQGDEGTGGGGGGGYGTAGGGGGGGGDSYTGGGSGGFSGGTTGGGNGGNESAFPPVNGGNGGQSPAGFTGTGGKSYGNGNRGTGGGGGGASIGLNNSAQLLFGSGGGASGAYRGNGTGVYVGQSGGTGGGMIIIHTQNISVQGVISANGINGQSANGKAGAGGGGAGGAIFIQSNSTSLGSNLIQSIGGSGGSPSGASGGGGQGGVGRIFVRYGTVTGATNPPASLQKVNYYSITGQSAPFGVFGNGSDGDLTITTGQTIYTDDIRTTLASTTSPGQSNINVSSVTGFAIGKEVLIIQIQGTGAGAYEFAAITNISGNTLTLSKLLANIYTVGGNSRVQILMVPQYNNLTVQSGGILTSHSWNGSTGGIVAFRASGNTNIVGSILASGNPATNQTGGIGVGFSGGNGTINSAQPAFYGEGITGASALATSGASNGNGGGGGRGSYSQNSPAHDGAGGGGGNSTSGGTGLGNNHAWEALGGVTVGNSSLTNIVFGGGGGGGSSYNAGGGGGGGGGIVLLFSRTIDITGTVNLNGASGFGNWGTGGGGAGGSALISGQTVNIGNNLITAKGAPAIGSDGANGGDGRIRIEYTSLNGATIPSASTQQVNYFNLTGSATGSLYLPDSILNTNSIRYQLLYGQRGSNTNGGDQTFSVHLPNRQYSSITMSSLIERVVASGSTFNFCLDIGNDGVCDYTANSQPFGEPVKLDTTNLAAALNTYITAQNSNAEMLTIPIRVNISTPADIFLFNMAGTLGADEDLIPATLTLTPPNNIPEGTQTTLGTTVTNNGTHKAENFTVAFYYKDDKAGARDILIGSTFIESLAPGTTSPIQSVNWNTSGLLGLKTVSVKVDASNQIAESNEVNNILTTQVTIRMKPDLVAVSMSIPDTRVGETVMVEAVIRNNGEGNANSALVKLYDDKPGIGAVLSNVTVNVPAGGSVTAQIPFTPASAGVKKLYIKADADNTISEANEGNNVTFSTGKTGWSLLTVDAGGAGDNTYSASSGYGWNNGTVATACGTEVEKSYRQAGSAETLAYRFDNLLPGRFYHLDLTFATCSGERWQDLLVDGHAVSEPNSPVQPVHVTTSPQTISLLIDPADYDDGAITLSIRRASGLSGPLVNIIDLQEIDYCYRDSSPSEQGWSASNNCGFDATPLTDGFDGWGTLPEQTMRFGDSGVNYKFSALNPAKTYNVRLTFFEGDNTGRNQRILFDGVEAQTTTLSSNVQHQVIAIPSSAYTDGQVIMSIQRIGVGEAIVNEVTLEEDSRTENNRYLLNMSALIVSKAGTGLGTVTSSPSGINCGVTCSANFGNNTSVTLTAAPAIGSTFTGWSGEGCSGTGTCVVTMSAVRSITATFTLNTYALTISKTGTGIGSVTSDLVGINCGAACSANFDYNTVVTLTAVASTGSTFTGWSGGGCSGTGICSVTMTAATTVTANFTLNTYVLTVSKAGTGSGTVTSSPAGINCGATCFYSYNYNTSVTLTATPDTGSTFSGWSGACTGTGTCTVAMSVAKSVTATFAISTYTLTYTAGANGTIVGTTPQTVNHGANGTLVTATPATGYHFVSWSDSHPTAARTDLNVTADKSVTATFAINTYTLTYTAGANGSIVGTTPQTVNHGANGTMVTATPAAGYHFVSWSDSYPTAARTDLNVTADKSVTATLAINTYTLTVNKSGTGSGTVASIPAGINCGATCSSTFDYNTVVTLTAVASTGSTFTGWSGADCSGTGTCSVTMTTATTVTATFDIQTPTLTVNKTGTGSGLVTSSPAGISCGSTCSSAFTYNTVVTLTAAATTGSTFMGWSGGGCLGTGTCSVTMTSATAVIATFNDSTLPIFADVPLSYWSSSFIERLYNAGITGGCSITPLMYCPDSTVTRAQMAVFLLRGIHGSSYSPPAVGAGTGFTDVPANYWSAGWIKQLAAEGITGGCGVGLYCPETIVTRAQMAVFLLRAKYTSSYTPPTATGTFADVPVNYWSAGWIEQLAAEGITGGCGVGIYCPESKVTRAQMAVFLVRTFSLP